MNINWLPEGKTAAVVWSIDDIHPAKSSDPYEAGGDLSEGALGHLEWLLERHPQLSCTMFVTADWRQISAFPTRRLLAAIPGLRNHLYLAPIRPKGTMAVDKHPDFVAYLNSLPRTEIALHGLHHVNKGLQIPVEFQNSSADNCQAILNKALDLFTRSGINFTRGMAPPCWELTAELIEAMDSLGFRYVSSARDIFSPVTTNALTNMSGLKGVPLIYPHRLNKMIHFTINFQATNDLDRALAIVEAGGLLSIKAHIMTMCMSHVVLDGLGQVYRNYLDVLFNELEDRFGDALWWTTMGEIADHMLSIDSS